MRRRRYAAGFYIDTPNIDIITPLFRLQRSISRCLRYLFLRYWPAISPTYIYYYLRVTLLNILNFYCASAVRFRASFRRRHVFAYFAAACRFLLLCSLRCICRWVWHFWRCWAYISWRRRSIAAERRFAIWWSPRRADFDGSAFRAFYTALTAASAGRRLC